MKLLLRSNTWLKNAISKACSSSEALFFYSTKTQPSPPVDTLGTRLSRAGNPRVSIVPVLEQWLDEGKEIKQSDLQQFIKILRKYCRFSHALQISEWMSDERNHALSVADIAIRLDLISKVHGLEQAEKYFNSIPENMRDHRVYGALLSCYKHNKSLENAETLMQIMRELGHAKNSLPYNVMMSLYSQMQRYEKLDILLKEMAEKGIHRDMFTFNIQLNAYVAASDVQGMEKLLMKIEADPHVKIDWNSYVVAANGYLKAGLIEKALTGLKKSEQLIKDNSRKFAYEVLISLYATARNKDEMHRIWNLYKKLGKFYNSGYLCMISSLVKLGDVDAAVSIYEEWESGKTLFDMRIPNILISGYCRLGLLEKAEGFVNKLLESGNEPNASTWNHLATGYKVHSQMAKAAEAMKKAILASQTERDFNIFTLAACIEYLKGQGDENAAEELLSLLKNGDFSASFYDAVLKRINSKNLGSGALDEMEGDNRSSNGERAEYMELKIDGPTVDGETNDYMERDNT